MAKLSSFVIISTHLTTTTTTTPTSSAPCYPTSFRSIPFIPFHCAAPTTITLHCSPPAYRQLVPPIVPNQLVASSPSPMGLLLIFNMCFWLDRSFIYWFYCSLSLTLTYVMHPHTLTMVYIELFD